MSLQTLVQALTHKKLKLVTAESCTAGGVARRLTSLPGSSEWFERGFVTYSNQSKAEMLGVNPETIQSFGAVSEQTVIEMARGALSNSQGDLVIAITGIAGPGGGTADKPVGTIWFGILGLNRDTMAIKKRFDGDREHVREQAVDFALAEMENYLAD